ncbi:hypothetical protein [Methylobacterium radiotolerans]|uniref:hypothetical protein n=1 Tax=Methylobacterium radiotolerans TaxID=31998 RepID=UPI001192A1FA|nr:hypothetical protein [Methylobacterium radiotolerans]GEM98380.1 hypothetical protein MRA01_29200 [Methylobacterium radiotolerans]
MHEPINDAEKLKIREQYRDFEGERFFLASKTYAEQSHAHRMNAFGNVKEYGLQSIRHLSLLNGGAILALLSFLGALIAKADEKSLLIAISFAKSLKPALLCFAAGLIAAGLLTALTYRNWLAIAESQQTPKQHYDLIAAGKCEESPSTAETMATLTHRLIFICGWSSLLLFIAGAYLVANAFTVLGV